MENPTRVNKHMCVVSPSPLARPAFHSAVKDSKRFSIFIYQLRYAAVAVAVAVVFVVVVVAVVAVVVAVVGVVLILFFLAGTSESSARQANLTFMMLWQSRNHVLVSC
eukprot:TRINITY_DN30221_c0_g1_i2.p1 TRINITY_DN30221_c0_g1~~TRINITY_DN30221_c0_g1_i2.p1  ORF type:complete len:108 (-),score=7.10 TRINITY_DN30221_c0_g1_i2:113-436(-)